MYSRFNDLFRRTSADSRESRLKGDGDSKNKTWTKKAQDYKEKTRKDHLAAIVAKAVKKGVRKELFNIESRKRESDSDSSNGEVNLIEDLNKFDLNDIDLDMITEYVDVDDL